MFGSNQKTGKRGEDLAVKYLKEKKYDIIARNYRQKWGEIDIVAKVGPELVFIEVKTRTSTAFGTPAEAVTVTKQRQIARVAEDYLSRHNLFDCAVRFDVISVLLLGKKHPEIEHIHNAFEAQ